jgi:hypothetical protein
MRSLMGQNGNGGTGIEERMYPTTPLPPVNIGHTLYLRIFGLRGKLKFTYYRGYSIHTYVQTGGDPAATIRNPVSFISY